MKFSRLLTIVQQSKEKWELEILRFLHYIGSATITNYIKYK